MRAAVLASAALGIADFARGQEVSPPVILQDFESSWQTITNRMPDIFAAGYGGVYTPPPGRAESGNQSVGYDVYDRFDLGSAGNPTLYGTANGLKNMVSAIHTMGGDSYIDLVWNQSGFADSGTPGFAAAGGYPGFALTLQTSNSSAPGYNTQGYNEVDGDYHSAYATGDQDERLAGLVDIAQESNNVFIRQPTVAGPDNIPGPTPGATAWFYTGLANVPNPANAQFYPSASGPSQTFYDPALNQTFTRDNFNNSSPMSGTPVAENATGYLMRYAQYMIQVIGADGFRVDAAKNMPEWVMNYLDLATYDSSYRTYLNGQQENVFSFSEVYDSSDSLLESYVNKSIYTSGANTVGGNRDVEDYPLYFAMDQNLSGNTSQNNWYNVVSASIDCYDPSNGTQDLTPSGNTGVKFVSNQDVEPPTLDSVAYAYILMMPGNAMVYYNGHNFGTEAQRNFPNDGREDALGGTYGTGLTTLVDLRNRYGRGNYRQDYLTTDDYAFEREGSALTLLSNNTNAGYDSVTIDVTFAPNTPLIELTGNAHGSVADPLGNIPQLLIVNADSNSPTGASVNARFLWNSAVNSGGTSVFTGLGYLIYGIPTPTGTLSLTNVASTFGGVIPNQSDSNIEYENGTDVVSTINVIKTATFNVQLNTVPANLLGYYRYQDADGDNALIKVDGGIDVANSNGLFTDPTNTVTYGFEGFTTTDNPGYYNASGNGLYVQTINTSQLGQGYHYITVEAFTHRTDGGPAIYTDWKETVYVDLAPPNSAPTSLVNTSGNDTSWTLDVSSVDGLANNVHTFVDLPFGLTNAQVLNMISSSNQDTQEDTNLWQLTTGGLLNGNHTVTIVSYKPDGTYNIQRFSESQYSFLGVTAGYGAGFGDLAGSGTITTSDISQFISLVESGNTQFNAAADLNGDGSIDLADTFLLGPALSAANVSSSVWTAYNNFIYGSYVTTHGYTVNGRNVIYQDTAYTTSLSAGAYLNATYIRGTSLNIAAGGKVQIQANPTFGNGASKISYLSMAGTTGAWTGQIDLANNPLVFESTSANKSSDLARLTNMVAEGYAGGTWVGEGITSSSAAADTTHLHALGIILNDAPNGSTLYSTFYNETADSNAILISYTYYGDANLDGKVDGSDYTLIDNGFLKHLTGWYNGDFNYDGVVNGSDYTLIDNAFNQQGAAGANPATLLTEEIALPTAAFSGSSSSSVPEPASIALLALGFTGLLGRKRTVSAGRITRYKS